MSRRPVTFETLALSLIALGLLTRALVWWFAAPAIDAHHYMQMGESFRRYGEFLLPWQGEDVYSWHFPPVYPLLFAASFSIFGTTLAAAGLVAFLCGAFLIAVATFTTWDLYGRERGLAVGALVAVLPFLVQTDTELLGESLVAGLFGLTLWAILKSLDRPWFIVLAGIFAGLGYLTKASLGPFFLIAGLCGLLWRISYVRWRVLHDVPYMVAIAVFALFTLPWAARNVLRHGWPNWETQPRATNAVVDLFQSGAAPSILLSETVWVLVASAAMVLVVLPEIVGSLRSWRDEHTSALWVAVGLPLLLAIVYYSAFILAEAWSTSTQLSNFRYLLTPIVPMLWLGVRDLDLTDPRPPGRLKEGKALLRAHRWLTVGAGGVVAFVTATGLPFLLSSRQRFVIYCIACVIGFVLALAARQCAWRPAKAAHDDRPWTAVPDHTRRGGYLPFVGGALVVLALFTYQTEWATLLVFLLAGGIALALPSPRGRILVASTILLSASLWTWHEADPVPDLAEYVNEHAAIGATVAVPAGAEQRAWTWLRPDLRITTWGQPADYLLDNGRWDDDGEHDSVHVTTRDWRPAPLGKVGTWLWSGLLDDDPRPHSGTSGVVWMRNARKA